MEYIYLTVSEYELLPKVRDDEMYSCYGMEYGEGWILPTCILNMAEYLFVRPYLTDKPIIIIEVTDETPY